LSSKHYLSHVNSSKTTTRVEVMTLEIPALFHYGFCKLVETRTTRWLPRSFLHSHYQRPLFFW